MLRAKSLRSSVLLILLGLCGPALLATPAADLRQIRRAWLSGQYPAAARQSAAYIKTHGAGNAQVYFMLATSLCRLPGDANRVDALAYFDVLLRRIKLDARTLAQIERERDACRVPRARPADVKLVSTIATGQLSITSGKTGEPNRLAGSDVEPLRVLRSLTPRELAEREYRATDSARAAREIPRRLAAPRANVAAGEQVLVVGVASWSPVELQTLVTNFDHAVRILRKRLPAPAPDGLITIYLVPHGTALVDLAERVHGIRPGPGTLGYTFHGDQSVVAVVTEVRGSGTVYHELTHLVLARSLPLAPPYLDEGLAALYESVVLEDDALRGTPNWRGRILTRRGGPVPLRELVHMSWPEFNRVTDADSERRAVQHASARYFALYLQDRDRLDAVIAAVRAAQVEPPRFEAEAEALLRAVGFATFDALEADFADWLKRTFDTGRRPDSVIEQTPYSPGPIRLPQ